MKQVLTAILILAVAGVGVGWATIPAHPNSIRVTLTNMPSGNYNDFTFKWSGEDDQKITLNCTDSMAGGYMWFRMTLGKLGAEYLLSSGTIATTQAVFSISRTNIPPDGLYQGEFLYGSTVSYTSGTARTLAQGTVNIIHSLFANTNSFTNLNSAFVGAVYVHPEWIAPPWLSDTGSWVSTYAPIAMVNGLSNYAGIIYNIATNAQEVPDLIAATNNIITLLDGKSATNHTHSEYLSSVTNRFDGPLTVGNLGMLNTNIADVPAGLMQATYTGSVTTVAYTGEIPIVRGRVYAYGFTKTTSYGTSTLSIAGNSLSATASGACSNYFAALTTNGSLVLRLDGDGVSLCNANTIYVKEITNGTMNVADNLYLGDSLFLGAPSNMNFADGSVIASLGNVTAASNALNGRLTIAENTNTSQTAWIGLVSNQAVVVSNIAVTARETNDAQTTWIGNVSNMVMAASNALDGRVTTVENTNGTQNTRITAVETGKVDLAGGVLSGPITNEAGYYGNGLGLTNIPDIKGISNDFIAADAGISNAFIAADAGISNTYNEATNTLHTAITSEVALARANEVGISNAFIAADTGISNTFNEATNTLHTAITNEVALARANEAGISNAYIAADGLVSNGFIAADSGISNAFEAADAGISNTVLLLKGGQMSGGLTTTVMSVAADVTLLNSNTIDWKVSDWFERTYPHNTVIVFSNVTACRQITIVVNSTNASVLTWPTNVQYNGAAGLRTTNTINTNDVYGFISTSQSNVIGALLKGK